ncbi:hypothetical protein GQ43DRAFT_362236, partial [Delitschia confertaspora ATCC 74209]
SSSSVTKRNLKPSPIAAAQQPTTQFTSSTELPNVQPASSAAHPEALFMQSTSPANSRKRKSVAQDQMANTSITGATSSNVAAAAPADVDLSADTPIQEPKVKKSRTNTPWTPAEEQRLKTMRDAGNSWNEIAKTFPQRTEGSVKKHWYKDMHYAEFAEDESAALLAAIKEYDTNKWKVIGAKVGKPAKACEQYAKEHFGGKY